MRIPVPNSTHWTPQSKILISQCGQTFSNVKPQEALKENSSVVLNHNFDLTPLPNLENMIQNKENIYNNI